MELFALDLGNIQTKIKSSKLEKVLPSKFAYYEDLGNQDTSIKKSKRDIKEYSVNYDNDFSYAWGADINDAKKVDLIDTIGFENRYSTTEFRLLSSFAIGELAKDFQEAKNGILEVDIVTGVPTNDFNEKAVKTLIKVLKADHNVVVDGVSLNVRVNEVKVIPQPIGTVYNKMLDDQGYIVEDDFDEETISVVDCGGGTILIDTLNNMNLDETGRSQEKEGAHHLYDSIISECSKENITLTKNDIEKILREQKDRYYFAPNKDESIEITKEVNRSITKYTRQLTNKVTSTLKDTSQIDTLFFTGGGANLINKKEVTKRFKRAIFIEKSETANVNGYYKYGLATAESDHDD
ncbi:ParM/StbA family protein [Thalassobacillus sp. B23F22_16]|uniref:ParM/StbA family protein n=1 Tax=Thalassobacillus sp. B23F22_16 TaxID=3459513 RepID=UPI00373FA15D